MKERFRIPWFHPIGNFLMKILFRLLLKLDVQGMEHVPRRGALVVVLNHSSFLDPAIVSAIARPDVFGMTKVEMFTDSYFGIILRLYGAFPVRRGEGDFGAMKHALRILEANHTLLMTPEGTRTKTGVMKEAHEGLALILLKKPAPIVPIAVWGGARQAFIRNLKHLHRAPFCVRIGQPLQLKPVEGKITREIQREIIDDIMYVIAEMLPSDLRGYYGDLSRATGKYLEPYREPAQTIPVKSRVDARQEVMSA
jgi:1-acyl-sn-glycerol-3-phosphate acyltransferase